MERVMAVLTDEEQALVRAIGITGVSTHRTSLACVVCIYLDDHRAMQQGLIRKHAVQLGKRPLGVGGIGLALLLARLFAPFARDAFSDVCQLFQADETVWVLGHDTLRDFMIGVLLQPSLPSTDGKKPSGCGTGAFLLQTLSQSRVMVGFGNNGFSSVEGKITCGGRGHSQVTDTHINTYHTGMGLRCWVCCLDFQANKQVELLAGLVIPELCGSNMSALLNKRNVGIIASVGHNDTPLQRQNTHPLRCLEAIVLAMLVSQRRRDVLRSLVKPFIAFLGDTCFAGCCILLHLRPERLVGGPDLAGHATGHLGWQMKTGTYLVVRPILQGDRVTLFAMLICIATHIVQGIAIGQLHGTQCSELFSARMQFEFGCNHRFHTSYSIKYSTACQERKTVERTYV